MGRMEKMDEKGCGRKKVGKRMKVGVKLGELEADKGHKVWKAHWDRNGKRVWVGERNGGKWKRLERRGGRRKEVGRGEGERWEERYLVEAREWRGDWVVWEKKTWTEDRGEGRRMRDEERRRGGRECEYWVREGWTKKNNAAGSERRGSR